MLPFDPDLWAKTMPYCLHWRCQSWVSVARLAYVDASDSSLQLPIFSVP